MPAVAVGIEALIDLGVLMCFAFLIALSFAYSNSLGVALNAVAGALDYIGNNLGPFGFLFSSPSGWIHDLDDAIRAALGTGITATEYVWHKMLQFTASTIAGIGLAVHYVANETYRTLDRLWRQSIPAYVIAKLAPLVRQLAGLVEHSGSVAKTAARTAVTVLTLPKIIAPIIITQVPRIARAVTNPAAVAAAITGTITLPRLRTVEREASALERWVRAHRDALGIGAITGATAYALSRLGLSQQSCSNNKRLTKGLCGVDPSVIENLLTDALLLASTISIVELAKECSGFVTDVEAPLRLFVRELRDLTPSAGGSFTGPLADYAAGRF